MTKLLEILPDAPVVRVEAGEKVIRQGDPVRRLLVLRDGEVQIIKDGTHVCDISTVGSVFGEIATLLGTHSTATVTARRNCEFAVIENPLEFLKENGEATVEIARLLAQRVRWLTIKYADELDDGESAFWRGR